MAYMKTPRKFLDEARAYDIATGFRFQEWWNIYNSACPPNVLFAALQDQMADIGVEVIEKSAHRDGIGVAESLMAFAATLLGWTPIVVANDQLVLTSTNAADTAAGAGAQAVRVEYIDDQGAEQAVEVEMQGMANAPLNVRVPLVPGCFAINDMYVVRSGTPPVSNVGQITLEDSTNARVYEAIQAGMGKAQTCRYHVPAGRRCFVFRVELAADAEDVIYALFADSEKHVAPALNQVIAKREMFCALPESGKWEHIFTQPIMVPPSIPGVMPSAYQLQCLSVGGASEGTASVFMAVLDDTV